MANLRVDKITSTETFETTGSVQFDGTDDGLTISDNAAFDLGTGDFTIEGWYYLVNAGTYVSLFDFRGSGADGVYPSLFRNNTGNYIYYYVDSAQRISNVTINYNTWFHVAVCRSSGITRLFLNGKEKGSFQDSFDYVSRDILLGLSASSSNDLKGNISNYRVVKGKALYTANFKPPMRELENVPGTVLLCCQSKTDASLEKTGKTITANGNAVASELTPGILTPVVKSGGGSAITGSVEFDGTGDYLSALDNTDFTFGTGDFTIEFWRYRSRVGSTESYVTKYNNTNATQSFWFGALSSGREDFAWYSGSNGYSIISANNTAQVGEWGHLAAVRHNGDITLYLNGVAIGSDTSSDAAASFNDDSNPLIIGGDNYSGSTYDYQGFISNLRIVKGTALYTHDFIPPTRELKKVPGTVLLCCQDPDNPLTEATGKTITPYGSLGDGSLGPELVTRDGVWTLACGGGSCSNYTVSNQGRSLAGSTVSGGYIRATYTLDKGDYLVSLRWTGGNFAVQDSTGYIVATDGTDTEFSSSEDGAYSFYMTDTTSVVITGTSWSTAYTVDDISIKRIYRNNGASNFTPQVGDDRKVTFEGVTKINTDAYFYFPTGDTASREATGTYNAGTRAVYHSGQSPDTSTYNTLEHLNIASKGSIADFGNLINQKLNQVACSSDTRGLFATGYTGPTGSDHIDYVTIMSKGDALNFGDLSFVTYVPDACSNQTRAIIAGGAAAPNYSGQTNMDYVVIASKGNGRDFGDLTRNRHSLSGIASPTRGVFAGGNASPTSNLNNIDYITFASTGNAQDFGDLPLGRAGCAGASSAIRGLFGGGYTASPAVRNIIDFITIATSGNSQDFGDLTAVRRFAGATSSATRGVFVAGFNPSATNTVDYVSIQTTGNAIDFGETINKTQSSACSNGHGGLG